MTGPVIVITWLVLGVAIAALYHASLWLFDGEFRVRNEQAFDVAFSVLRGLFYVVLWPVVFLVDRSAFRRIRLMLAYLDPKERIENKELQAALKERDYRVWASRSFTERRQLDRRRRREMETGEQRARRLVKMHADSPDLEQVWMLTGVGSNPGGVHKLVHLYPQYHLAEEVAADARKEIVLRRPRICSRCQTRLAVSDVRMPGLIFLRVLEPETEKLVVEGWALRGTCAMRYETCPQCGLEPPEVREDLAAFGRATDVVKGVREGITLHLDLPG